MSILTIKLTDDRLRALKKLSTRLNVSPEELVRLSIEDILSHPEDTVQRAMDYVLEKNSELYRRLAA